MSRMTLLAMLLPCLALVACGSSSNSAPAPPIPVEAPAAGAHPVEVTLLADVSAFAPGEPFLVGVQLKMRPGWHVYWKNPGDAGLAPSIEVSLPPGFAAGEILWPVPERFEEEGGIVAFGYADSVLLLRRVTPPAQGPVGAVRVGVRAAWLTCEKVCIPGSATLELSIPAAERAAPANRELFEAWAARLPVDVTRPGGPATVRVEAMVRAGARASFAVQLQWARPPRTVEWFPPVDAARVFENGHVETTGTRTRIRFDAEILAGQKPSSDLFELVVAYEDEAGARRGLVVPVAAAGSERASSAPDPLGIRARRKPSDP